MSIVYDIEPQVALNRGLERFNIIWQNIGNQGTGSDSQSVLSGALNFSLAGLAIAPGSVYTEISIRSITSPPFGSGQLITPTSPFIGDMPGPFELVVPTLQGRFNDNYWPTGTTTIAPFGQTMGTDPNGTNIFGARPLGLFPSASLIAYLRPPSSVFNADLTLFDEASITVAAGTNVVRVFCVQGRRRLRVMWKCSSGGTYDAQVTASSGAVIGNMPEYVIGAPVSLVANGEAFIDIEPLVDVFWVFFKLTRTAGTPIAYYRFEAE